MATLMLVLRLDKDDVGLLDNILTFVLNFVMVLVNSSVGEDSILLLVCTNIALTYVECVVVDKKSFEVVVFEKSI